MLHEILREMRPREDLPVGASAKPGLVDLDSDAPEVLQYPRVPFVPAAEHFFEKRLEPLVPGVDPDREKMELVEAFAGVDGKLRPRDELRVRSPVFRKRAAGGEKIPDAVRVVMVGERHRRERLRRIRDFGRLARSVARL